MSDPSDFIIERVRECVHHQWLWNVTTRTHTHIMILVAITIWYSYVENKRYCVYNHKQAPAECRPSIPVSHWALRSLPSLWWPGSSWPALKERAGVINTVSTGHSCLRSSSVLPYICFLVADHRRPSLARWQIEVHRVPADTIFEPGWSEKRSSARSNKHHIYFLWLQ